MAKLHIFVLVSILSFDWIISQDDIRKPPNISTPRVRTDLYYAEYTSVSVNCSADGIPLPTYKWTVNGTEISQTAIITVDPVAGTLKISSFSRREEGSYVCIASNSFNNGQINVVSFSAPVRLWQTRIEKFDNGTAGHNMQEHDYLRLLCNKKAVVGAQIKYNWYSTESTSILLDNYRLFINQEGNLHFTYVVLNDASISYSCGISVDQDKMIVLGTRNFLTVNPSTNLAPIKPYLQYSNSGVKGLRFSVAKLECMFSGFDPVPPYIPIITWRDDSGQIIPNNMKYSVSPDGRTLTITNLQEEDEKSYSCSARNGAGEASGSVFLNVTSGPIFVNGLPPDQAASQYSDAVFNCDARSASRENPPSQPVWSINGDKTRIQTDPRKFQLSEDKKILTIKNVSKANDIMCIQCEVSNDVDSVLANACLNVLLPITIEKQPALRQEINYGDNVDLTVTASTDPSMNLNYRWEFDNKSYVGSDHPPFMFYNPTNNLAYINTSSLTQEQYGSIGGPYKRVIYHLYDSKTVEIDVILKDRQATSTEETTSPGTTESVTSAVTPTVTATFSPTVRHDFECHASYMQVFVPVAIVPNTELTLRDPTCKLVNNGTHHKITFSYDECGTSQTFFEDNVDVQNDINIHMTLNSTSDITFVDDYKIPLQCSVSRSAVVNAALQVVSRDNIREHLVQSADIEMKEFTTAEYQEEITEYPVKVPINKEIFFEVVLKNSSTNSSGILVEKCEATPSSDPQDVTQVSLINSGCSANPAVKVQPSPGIDRFRFSTQAFHFSGPVNNNSLVYIHCSVSTCGENACSHVCLGTTRRRRSARRSPLVTLTSGSHVMTNGDK